MSDLSVGRSVHEDLHVVQAFQFTASESSYASYLICGG